MSGLDTRIEEWTRRKSYLLRSLFDDDPMLSTILEEDESTAQYSRQLETRDRERSSSPLPDLVVEVVYKRPKHVDDEPEEYYKWLEKQMQRLYRRDYLKILSTSDDNTEPESDNEGRIDDNDCSRDSYDDNVDLQKTKEGDDEDNIYNDNDNVRHDLSPITEESCIEQSTSSASMNATNVIQTRAVIENEMEPSDVNSTLHSDKVSTHQSSEGIPDRSNENESEDEEHDGTMELAENNGASSVNESVSTIPEPEAMRRQEARLSLFSISNDFEKSSERLVAYQGKQLVFMEETLDSRESINVIRGITDVSGKATSTPNSRRESRSLRLSKRKTYDDRYDPYASSLSSKSCIQKCDRILQTSFSEEESIDQSFWQNIFVGTPIFLKIPITG